MNITKIVFIGAGSVSFGMSMFKDLFSSRELKGSTLVLVDINGENLEKMYAVAQRMNIKSGAGLFIEKTSDRRSALPGASFVFNSTAIERNRLWKLDFEVPKKYGVRHTLGENGGPGGLFFTLRTIPLVLDIAHDMEELCPEAVFINFSNPESRIILALGRYTKIHAIGLCHGVFMGQHDVARIMEMPVEQVDVWAAGLNHFQWLLKICQKESGEDLYPLLRQKEPFYNPEFMPLSRKLFRIFGYYPSCSDDHIGEYLSFGWEAGEEGYNFEQDENYRVFLKEETDHIIAGEPIDESWFKPSGERGVAIVNGILHNKKQWIESGVIYNQHKAITNLSADAAVEVPVLADANGLHACQVGDLPPAIARLLSVQVNIQQMSVEAAVFASKEMALQTMLLDPVIQSTRAAEMILNELWEVNKPYIRRCI